MFYIKKVETKKEQKLFLDFPLKLYKGNPYFVPPLYMDEKKIFSKNYVYNDTCEHVYFLCFNDKKEVVGRISAILQKASNEKHNEKRVRFTRFDSIDNQEVANLLFKSIESWAKEKKMDTIVGPLGFSDLEREGLLIEGFDELATFEEQYNYPYYQKLIENLGYVKEVDWIESKLYAPEDNADRMERISNIMLRRYKLHFGTAKTTAKFLDKYKDQIFEILDTTYVDIYGTVPFTDGMKKMMISNFKLLLSLKYIAIILDQNDKIVCFGICLPSIARAVQKSQGHLTLPCIIKLLKARKHPQIIDLALVGVLPEYAKLGVSAAILAHIMKMLKNGEVEYAETNLNLEDNMEIRNNWKNFKQIEHKRRRSFVKKLDV